MAGCGQKCPANPDLICNNCSPKATAHCQRFKDSEFNQFYWDDNDLGTYQEFDEQKYTWNKFTVPERKPFTTEDIEAIRALRKLRFGD